MKRYQLAYQTKNYEWILSGEMFDSFYVAKETAIKHLEKSENGRKYLILRGELVLEKSIEQKTRVPIEYVTKSDEE